MSLLTRETYLARKVLREVELPGGASVMLRALPASYMVEAAEKGADAGGRATEDGPFSTASLLLNSLCDEEGNLLFAPGADRENVLALDMPSLKAVLAAIADLNGLTPEKGGEAEAAEAAPAGESVGLASSPTASPKN